MGGAYLPQHVWKTSYEVPHLYNLDSKCINDLSWNLEISEGFAGPSYVDVRTAK